MSRTVKVERSNTYARYVAEVTLETGKALTRQSEWVLSHWNKLEDGRNQALYAMERDLEKLYADYGLKPDTPIRVYLEKREQRTYTETNTTRRFASEHTAGEQK